MQRGSASPMPSPEPGAQPLLQKPELGISIPICALIWYSKYKSDTSQAAARNLFSADAFSKPGRKMTMLLRFRLGNATGLSPLPAWGMARVPHS